MYKVLAVEPFEPFLSTWGSWCTPVQINIEEEILWVVPDGWQSELTAKNIAFTEIEIEEDTEG